MTSDELKLRTKKFALRIINLIEHLPNNKSSHVLGNQFLRSATSLGANYRAACRSRLKKEFISKIRIVEEEADESVYWIETIKESKLINEEKVGDLLKESNELTAIFTSIGKTSKLNLKNSKSEIPNSKLNNA
ncbi:MAG: four helix bundle protein [Bacteroidota bacterium]|nr:four helix bundle protein [Bacteroidota bacterium]